MSKHIKLEVENNRIKSKNKEYLKEIRKSNLSNEMEEFKRSKLLKLKEAATLLQVHPRTLIRYYLEGRIPAFRYKGHSYRFLESDLLLFMKESYNYFK